MRIARTNAALDRKVWLRHLGITGFAFFLFKGLLWLLVPALFAIWR